MHGLFRRLFAPRWQHPDAETRRQALATLDPANPEQRKTLERLTQDPDASVRWAALERLDDLPRLMDEAASWLGDAPVSDSATYQALLGRLCGRIGCTDLTTRKALLTRIEQPRLLSAIAFEGDNLGLRLQALERLDDEIYLIEQACDNGVASVRQRAAERVTSEEGLKQLVKQARRDRQVMRLARDRLGQLRADAEWVTQQENQRKNVLDQLEQQARSSWEPLYGARLRHLQREWEQLTHPASAEEEAHYQQAIIGCRRTLQQHEAQEESQRQSESLRDQSSEQREQLITSLEETLSALRQARKLSTQDMASLAAQRRLHGQRWQTLSDSHPPSESQRQRYQAAIAIAETFGDAWQRLLEQVPALELALEADDYAALEQALRACRWPSELKAPPLIADARRALEGANADSTANSPSLDQAEEDLDTLEQWLERGNFNNANRLHQRVKPAIDALTGSDAEPLQARLKKLGARLAEMRDWRGFAAGPKRTQLCAAIEALADDETLGDDALDRRHRQLVKEWSALGDAAANREQSTQFRSASDRIHQRLASWRERLIQEREVNLKAREALCEQLEALLDQPADNADPDALREIRDKARHQWRHHTPVPREQADAIGRRFGKIRHRLQALIDERAEQIADHKRHLVEATQALSSSDQPLSQRIEQAKALQQQWRALGRAPKGEEQALWKAFRAECDRLFAERDEQSKARASHQQAQLDAMQALIDQMEQWQPNAASESAQLNTFLAEAERLEPLPRHRRSEGMQRRLSGIARARRERLSRLAMAEIARQWKGLIALQRAHLAADQKALDEGVRDEVDAQAVVGNEALPPEARKAHKTRNRQRLALAQEASSAQATEMAERLARLRVHLALLVQGRVMQGDEPLRLAIQVERLNESMNQLPDREAEIRSVLAAILALGPMPLAVWEKEKRELGALLEHLGHVPPP